jgi:XTP/dITP diphosphohydrolase
MADSLPVLCLATRNAHKVSEMASVLAPWFRVVSTKNFPDIPEIEETGNTFLANAELKAIAVSLAIPGNAFSLADDSGIEVDALGGAPGIYSARYGGEPCSDERNNQKVLAEMREKGAVTPQARGAHYRCVLVLAREGKTIASFDGTCSGHLIEEYRGKNGFGYDPLFIPEGYTETFGELSSDIKAQISHRAKALALFIKWLEQRDVASIG